VHQRHPATAVHAGQYERRRGDRPGHAEAGADPLGERGLAGAERAGENDEVAGPQQLGEPAAERLGVGDRGQLVVAPHSVAATAVRSASSAARGAPFGPKRIAAEGW
jgi:hypothetical protein